jgi:hypothetical protein
VKRWEKGGRKVGERWEKGGRKVGERWKKWMRTNGCEEMDAKKKIRNRQFLVEQE